MLIDITDRMAKRLERRLCATLGTAITRANAVNTAANDLAELRRLLVVPAVALGALDEIRSYRMQRVIECRQVRCLTH